jgi:hypothetical protein
MTRSRSFLVVALIVLGAGCADDAVDSPDLAAAPKVAGIAVVRGKLAGGDGGATDPKVVHDQIIAGARSMAMAAGDTGHAVFLGMMDAQQFIAVDTWNDLAAAKGLYTNPSFGMALGALFASAPTVDYYVYDEAYARWGAITPSVNGLPTFAFVVEGTFKETDPTKARAAHNQVAEGGKAAAMAMTDVAHLPFTKEGSPPSFFDIDVWKDPAKAQALYTDPMFAAAFLALFSGTPTVTPYSATDWAQW